jgi:hypothetical protein
MFSWSWEDRDRFSLRDWSPAFLPLDLCLPETWARDFLSSFFFFFNYSFPKSILRFCWYSYIHLISGEGKLKGKTYSGTTKVSPGHCGTEGEEWSWCVVFVLFCFKLVILESLYSELDRCCTTWALPQALFSVGYGLVFLLQSGLGLQSSYLCCLKLGLQLCNTMSVFFFFEMGSC